MDSGGREIDSILVRYDINDPTGDSVYSYFRSKGLSDEQITEKLNKRILWTPNEENLITIKFPFYYGLSVRPSYNIDDLPNLISLMGGIYTLYHEPLRGLTRVKQEDKDKLGENPTYYDLAKFTIGTKIAGFTKQYHPLDQSDKYELRLYR